MPYCGTHLTNARRRAETDAIHEHRSEYVEDAAVRAVVDADRDLKVERRAAGR